VVTAISSVTEQAVREAAPRVRDVRRIPMGVTTHVQPEASRVDRLRARHRRGDGPLLLFTGRHVDEKGVEDVLRAVALLVPRLPDVSAIIGGEGRDRPAFERLARELRLDGRVAFTGWAPGPELPSLFAAADVFVAPSRRAPTGWIEGQGIAPLEAMLHRTPVVATNLGGYADTVLHEQTGLVVAERSPHHIARAVERLVEEPLLAERLRERGHRMVVEHFSRRSVAERFASVFTALADRRRRHEEASPART
jgi:glycosyltransferase involved in cell wall biosynthesis